MIRTCWVMVLGCLAATAAMAQQQGLRVEGNRVVGNKIEQHEGRPRITYGGTRSSTRWVTNRQGIREAVDDGIEWKGRTYWLGLTWSLSCTEADDKAIWSHHVSAFWDQLGVEPFKIADGETVDALALRCTRHRKFVEYRDLQTGKRIGGTEDREPGKSIALAKVWKGYKTKRDAPLYARVRTESEWTKVYEALFKDVAGSPPAESGVDFKEFEMLVIFTGKGSNCNGYSGQLFENDEALFLRMHAHTYQSSGDTPSTWPYGVFVIPRRDGKRLIIQRNGQHYIGGPPMWQNWDPPGFVSARDANTALGVV